MVFKSNKNSVKMDRFHVVCVSACALPLVSAHVCESLCCYYDNNPFTRACTLSFPCLGVKFSLETGTGLDVCVHACSGQSSKALKAVDSFVPLLMCSWPLLCLPQSVWRSGEIVLCKEEVSVSCHSLPLQPHGCAVLYTLTDVQLLHVCDILMSRVRHDMALTIASICNLAITCKIGGQVWPSDRCRLQTMHICMSHTSHECHICDTTRHPVCCSSSLVFQ